MGCVTSNSKRTEIRPSLDSSQIPASNRHSDKFHSVRNSLRHVSGYLETEEDFWGTMPYYVIKNRVRHLLLHYKDKEILAKIFESIQEILLFFLQPSQNETKFEISSKRFAWISELDHGNKLIRAVGLKINDEDLEVNQGVTVDHLRQKLHETKFAFAECLGNGNCGKTI